jgi:hypothetical protein
MEQGELNHITGGLSKIQSRIFSPFLHFWLENPPVFADTDLRSAALGTSSQAAKALCIRILD